MSENKWCYSFNEEHYEGLFDTKEAAIEEAKYYIEEDERDQDNIIWVGQVKELTLGVNVDSVLEQLAEDAYDEVEDYADGFLDNVTLTHQQVLKERLNSVLSAWMNEFGYAPNFWTVKNVEKIIIAPEEEK